LRLLLDTVTLLWFWENSPRLPDDIARMIRAADNMVHVSSISAMEIATKHRVGKLPGVERMLREFQKALERDGFIELELSVSHGLLAGQIDASHRDPFDRMLAAQARVEQLAVVSPDTAFDALGAQRIW
jgi:PIN domain nuclease of toxin-antitoxin system